MCGGSCEDGASTEEITHGNRIRSIHCQSVFPQAAETARALGPELARRANSVTDEDTYVADNVVLLKEAGLVEAGVPRELGGGGAEVDDLAAMLRSLAYHCGSTGLAFSMHTHQVAIPAWRWRHQKIAAVEPLLQRVAKERIMLLSSGGSDWIGGSGKAEKVEGGFRITARKVFTSGGADRRHPDDRRDPRHRGRADGAAFRHSDELAPCESPRQLADAGHARHRLA